MAVLRMDNVGIVVDDLDAVIAFFQEIGLELEGRGTVEGPWVDRTIDLEGVSDGYRAMNDRKAIKVMVKP